MDGIKRFKTLTSVGFFMLLVLNAYNGYGASIESQLQALARETRKGLPMLVDDVQATNIAAVGKALILYYNFQKRKPDIGNLHKYYDSSVNSACSNPDTRRVLNLGVLYVYEYYDVDNIFVMNSL